MVEIETTPEMIKAAQFSNTTLESVKSRVYELIEASQQGDLDNRLLACFWLEAYGVECAGVIPGSPILVEYLDFKAHFASILEDEVFDES